MSEQAETGGVECGPIDGVGRCAFYVSVPFALRSKSNFRRGRTHAARQWDEFRSFESSVAFLLAAARPESWNVGDAQAKVAERPVVVCAIVARSMVDTANFSKSVLDAAQGVLYVNDASVLGVSSMGVRSRSGQQALVAFAQLDGGASLEEIARACGELSIRAASAASSLDA